MLVWCKNTSFFPWPCFQPTNKLVLTYKTCGTPTRSLAHQPGLPHFGRSFAHGVHHRNPQRCSCPNRHPNTWGLQGILDPLPVKHLPNKKKTPRMKTEKADISKNVEHRKVCLGWVFFWNFRTKKQNEGLVEVFPYDIFIFVRLISDFIRGLSEGVWVFV